MASAFLGELQRSLPDAFELSGPSLRLFHRAVASLTRLGRDIVLLFRPEELILHAADDAHSAAMQFAFRRRCFRAVPAPVRGAPLSHDVVVSSRALLVALKCAQQRAGQIDGMILGLAGLATAGSEPRLVLEFSARFGGKVRHRVPLLDGAPFLPGEPALGPHSAALAPSLLARILDHCSPPTRGATGCEEVSLAAVPGEGLRVQSSENRTEVQIHRSDLQACSLDGYGGEVTFSGRGLRDFARAGEHFARDLDAVGLSDGSPLIELRFGLEGSSVVCRLSSQTGGTVQALQDFTAVLIVATRDAKVDGDVTEPSAAAATARSRGPGASQAAPAASQARQPQPRQGAKRRAVGTPVIAEAFDAFPDHSASASQPSRTQPPGASPFGARHPAAAVQLAVAAAFGHPSAGGPAGAAVGTAPMAASRSQPAWQAPASFAQPGGAAAAPAAAAAPLVAAPGAGLAAAQGHPPVHTAPAAGAPVHEVQRLETPAASPRHMLPPQHQHLFSQGSTIGSSAPTGFLQRQPQHSSQPLLPPGLPAQSPTELPVLGAGAGGLGAGLQLGQAMQRSAPAMSVQDAVAHAMLPPAAASGFTRRPAGDMPNVVSASELFRFRAEAAPDSDDELIGADPDEVAMARGAPMEESVDWFDVENAVW